MDLFSGGVSGAAPLQLQLGISTSTVQATVVGFTAAGENAAGTGSRPTLSRPSTPGVGSGPGISSYSPSGTTNLLPLYSSFSSAPTIPSTNSINLLPLRVTWRSNKSNGFVVAAGGYALLYAYASGGQTWTGEMVWEE